MEKSDIEIQENLVQNYIEERYKIFHLETHWRNEKVRESNSLNWVIIIKQQYIRVVWKSSFKKLCHKKHRFLITLFELLQI